MYILNVNRNDDRDRQPVVPAPIDLPLDPVRVDLGKWPLIVPNVYADHSWALCFGSEQITHAVLTSCDDPLSPQEVRQRCSGSINMDQKCSAAPSALSCASRSLPIIH